MKKDTARGLLALFLSAAVISLAVLSFSGGRSDIAEGLFQALPYAGFALLGGFYLLLFAVSKGRRLRMALLLAAAVGGGFLLNYLHLSSGKRLFAILGALLLYLLGCILYSSYRFHQAIRPFNKAVLAYRRDHDGEKFLEALDRCAPALPKGGLVKKTGIGTITLQELLDCERIEVLGSMGRLERRQALINRIRQETKNPDLRKWLDEKEAEFPADTRQEDFI